MADSRAGKYRRSRAHLLVPEVRQCWRNKRMEHLKGLPVAKTRTV
ncbi:hypothetical protein Cadr_000018705 [Camelus dromedarius]|uniref:Uncharacterized protein n=1 Tax=Camelus dromedarius TaxID=9838 RepID=A0A5N4D358_CAMDR|nr:hypothetical protein Cadr_000018705 [Camelus dromedarius]